jgi:hypothetical protein
MWVFTEASDSNPYPAAYFTPAPPTIPHPDAPHILIICARREEGAIGPHQEVAGLRGGDCTMSKCRGSTQG